MRRIAMLALIVVLLGLASPSAGTQALGRRAPDLIVRHAVLLTMDPHTPSASAFAVTGDRFVAVGSDFEVLRLAGPNTTVIDLEGMAVTPGFIDSHSHWIGDRRLYGVKRAGTAIQTALEGGWTSINEMFVNEGRLAELSSLDSTGELRLRVNAYLPVNYAQQRFGMWFRGYTPGEVLGPRLRLAGVKFFIDGCTARTMYMTPSRGHGPPEGNFHWDRQELRRMVARVHDAGWQIAAHTCGDAAADEILDALELAFGKEDGSRYRARIEHALALRDDQIRRIRRMGVSPSFQLTWADGDWKKAFNREFDHEQRERLGRWRDLAEDPRLHSMGSTDTPYGESFPDLEPSTVMDALAQATTRIHTSGQRPAPYMRDQRLTVMQGIRLLTIDGAYGIFAEDDLGSITRGKLADFVVLSQDPRDVRVRNLESIDVAVVVVGGKQEVCASGYEESCLRSE